MAFMGATNVMVWNPICTLVSKTASKYEILRAIPLAETLFRNVQKLDVVLQRE